MKFIYSVLLPIAIVAGSTLSVQASTTGLLPVLTSPAYNSSNIFTVSGFKGQCTWFTYGRVLEKLGVKLPAEFYSNAITWYSRNATDKVYNYGSQPKTDSIAVWSGGSVGNGHVGYVEKVTGDSVYFNEANYSVRLQYQGYLEMLSKEGMANRGNCFIVGYVYVTEKYFATQQGQVKLTYATSTLNVRSGASATASVIGTLPNKTKVTIVGKSGTWDRINYANSTGYISASYVTQ